MEWLYEKSHVRGGGTAARGGQFHVSFRSGSRGNGACARSSHDYITREGQYESGDRDPAIYTESDHMPSWAAERPREYWDAADLYERANGRLYVSADFALPRDLSREDQVTLAREFAQELTKDGSLPYTLAIHAGHDSNGSEHNPHAHLMISERKNDGVERSREQWFSRANKADPSRGGTLKTREIHGRVWMEHARERWADLTNKTLARLGRDERVDHRSYARQGIDANPGRHFGPAAAHMLSRGHSHNRLELAASLVANQERLHVIDREMSALESERQRLATDAHTRPEPSLGSPHAAGADASSRDQDDSRSR
jgi:hypothetical protein